MQNIKKDCLNKYADIIIKTNGESVEKTVEKFCKIL